MSDLASELRDPPVRAPERADALESHTERQCHHDETIWDVDGGIICIGCGETQGEWDRAVDPFLPERVWVPLRVTLVHSPLLTNVETYQTEPPRGDEPERGLTHEEEEILF